MVQFVGIAVVLIDSSANTAQTSDLGDGSFEMVRKKVLMAKSMIVLVAFGAMMAGSARAAEPGEPGRPTQALTVDDALAQLQLHPRDAYFQYVALQLARRAGEDELKRVARLIMSRELRAVGRRRAGRGEDIDLLSMTTGALAVQESLQLDAMADLEMQRSGPPNVPRQCFAGTRSRNEHSAC